MSVLGYEPTWAGLVEPEPSPHELHALITPPDLLRLTLGRLSGEEGIGMRRRRRFISETARHDPG